MGADYSLHAKYWDWDAYDNTPIYAFWYRMSQKYGADVLSAMCAIGQTAAYMAANGANVTALDFTKEMIEEGKKRFGGQKNLHFIQADIRDFALNRIFDFCFLASADIHLLPSASDVKKALVAIGKHMRIGGGLGLEVYFAPQESFSTPYRRFEPRVPREDGVYIWKESCSAYSSETKIQSIHQIVHVEEPDIHFEHTVTLQLYDRETLFELLNKCGFSLVNAYSAIDFTSSSDQNKNYYLECIKR